jgi:dinuclear metal center YbgI/SA1388 family protein
MQLKDLIAVMEQIAPTRLAESWDNVGLLAGDPEQLVSNVLLAIDYTAAVAAEAAGGEIDAVIAYHPPLFHAIKQLTTPSLVFDAIRRGIALYSPHTALDVAEGGTNDVLADALGLIDRQPLRRIDPKVSQYKLVTFVPEKDLERLSQALFDAGAGNIGRYTHCSFRSAGTGTFRGEEGTHPAVGQAGRLEQANEVRIETVVPISQLAAIIQALRQSHPYEEPAFDLVQLAAPPEAVGIGRIGTLPATDRAELIERVKQALGLSQLLVAGPVTGAARRAACCAGAGGELLADALAQQADVYLTGELRHHDALAAAAQGVTLLCTLHSNSERPALGRLMGQLQARLPSIHFQISRSDRDPFVIH